MLRSIDPEHKNVLCQATYFTYIFGYLNRNCFSWSYNNYHYKYYYYNNYDNNYYYNYYEYYYYR